MISEGATISLKEGSHENQIYLRAKENPRLDLPDYLQKEEVNGKEQGKLIAKPSLEHIPFAFDSGLFTEYYAARKV